MGFLFLVTDNDREIAKMLINEEFDCVEAKDFSGTGLELESKIDKVYILFIHLHVYICFECCLSFLFYLFSISFTCFAPLFHLRVLL